MRNGRNNNQNDFSLFEIHIHYFLYMQGIFKFLLKKSPPPKVSIPTKNPNLPLVPTSENGSIPPPSLRRDANYEIPLDMSMYMFNCNKTVEAILKCL